MKALRSRLSDMARRISGLSHGGLSRLTTRFRLTFADVGGAMQPPVAGLWGMSAGIRSGGSVLEGVHFLPLQFHISLNLVLKLDAP